MLAVSPVLLRDVGTVQGSLQRSPQLQILRLSRCLYVLYLLLHEKRKKGINATDWHENDGNQRATTNNGNMSHNCWILVTTFRDS